MENTWEIRAGDIFETGDKRLIVISIEKEEAEVASFSSQEKAANICYYPLDKIYSMRYVGNVTFNPLHFKENEK
jgi:hypothetical protein